MHAVLIVDFSSHFATCMYGTEKNKTKHVSCSKNQKPVNASFLYRRPSGSQHMKYWLELHVYVSHFPHIQQRHKKCILLNLGLKLQSQPSTLMLVDDMEEEWDSVFDIIMIYSYLSPGPSPSLESKPVHIPIKSIVEIKSGCLHNHYKCPRDEEHAPRNRRNME